ncbi:MAG: precorrin-2 C(20)-methyltransferase [Deltaproteobacteria bacterium]|nr:precorrin-2 C(20)-methyltransferase [Deltaproteobacteria bacterium]
MTLSEKPEKTGEHSKAGTLYGIGVGPGDPDLITVMATKILGEVEEIFTASSSANEDSLAAKIASPYIKPGAKTTKLSFPMTSDRKLLESAWDENAAIVAKCLNAGRSAAFLTLGDCLTYSTYSYLLRHLYRLSPEAKVVSIPGVTSYQLAAAKLNRPLVIGRETLAILGGSAQDSELDFLSQKFDNLVLLKSYRDTNVMIDKLKSLGLAQKSALCANLSLIGETIIDGLDGEVKVPESYFSLILVNTRDRD